LFYHLLVFAKNYNKKLGLFVKIWQEPTQQTKAGQPVPAKSRTPPTSAPPIQHGQHARQPAIQHSQPAYRAEENLQCRGHGQKELGGGDQFAR